MNAPLVRRSPAHQGRVVAARSLTPRMRRVTVESDALVGLQVRPAQDVELHLQELSGRRVKRRYTIRHARPDVGEIDLDVLLHGDGPGSQWGAGATPGDRVTFQGPRGKLELRPAPWHLLVGDESALPAIAAIAEAVDTPVHAFIEVHDTTDVLPVDGDVTWVRRGYDPPGQAELLTAALEDAALPDGPGAAYLMGESRAMVALRAVVEARGIDHDAIFLKGYWNIGRPDRLAGRPPG